MYTHRQTDRAKTLCPLSDLLNSPRQARSSAIAEWPRDASSVVILPITTQQCRNYLYDKSWPNRRYEVGVKKIEVSSVSRCGKITRGVKFLNGSADLHHTLFSEDFSSAGWDLLWQVNVPKMKSLYRFTRYEAMNGSAKCRKWGDLVRLGGTQNHGQCHHSIERIRLPIRL